MDRAVPHRRRLREHRWPSLPVGMLVAALIVAGCIIHPLIAQPENSLRRLVSPATTASPTARPRARTGARTVGQADLTVLRVAGLMLNRPQTSDSVARRDAITTKSATGQTSRQDQPESKDLRRLPVPNVQASQPHATFAAQGVRYNVAQSNAASNDEEDLLVDVGEEDLLSPHGEDLLTNSHDEELLGVGTNEDEDLLNAPSQIVEDNAPVERHDDQLAEQPVEATDDVDEHHDEEKDAHVDQPVEELPPQGPAGPDNDAEQRLADPENLPAQALGDRPGTTPSRRTDNIAASSEGEVAAESDEEDLLLGTEEDLLDPQREDEASLPEEAGVASDSLLNEAGPPRENRADSPATRGFRRPDLRRERANPRGTEDSDPDGVDTNDGARDDDGEHDAEREDAARSDSDAKQQTTDLVVSTMPQYEVGNVAFDPSAFTPDPDYSHFPYMPPVEDSVFSGKTLNPTERPWVELGRGMYLPGRIPCSQTFMGIHNLVSQHFLVYGDYRTATAYVDGGANDRWVWAHRLNLDFDWMITDTERVHGFSGPIDRGTNFTRLEHNDGDFKFFDEFDHNWDTIFFEGDVGSILGGIMGHDSRFDMPFAVGLMPLLFQNGIWMEDAFVGAAVTLPAQHNAMLGWSNYELTFFAGIDELNSPAFPGDDSAASLYGVISFIEAYDGYLELGYAFLDDTSGQGLGYHNVGFSFSRRYWHRVSNALRVIVNAGQDPVNGPRTADGALFLVENALITSKPNTFVPYMNLFAGYGRPQSVARAAVAGGILRNTGILFETDGLTGFPFLDDTANNSYGGAIGINWLGPQFNYQVILEAGMVQTFGRAGSRRATDDQYGIGARFQKPLTNAWLVRMDALYGLFENDNDISGGRVELRYKF